MRLLPVFTSLMLVAVAISGRRGGGFLSTSGSFVLSKATDRAGGGEELGEELDHSPVLEGAEPTVAAADAATADAVAATHVTTAEMTSAKANETVPEDKAGGLNGINDDRGRPARCKDHPDGGELDCAAFPPLRDHAKNNYTLSCPDAGFSETGFFGPYYDEKIQSVVPGDTDRAYCLQWYINGHLKRNSFFCTTLRDGSYVCTRVFAGHIHKTPINIGALVGKRVVCKKLGAASCNATRCDQECSVYKIGLCLKNVGVNFNHEWNPGQYTRTACMNNAGKVGYSKSFCKQSNAAAILDKVTKAWVGAAFTHIWQNGTADPQFLCDPEKDKGANIVERFIAMS